MVVKAPGVKGMRLVLLVHVHFPMPVVNGGIRQCWHDKTTAVSACTSCTSRAYLASVGNQLLEIRSLQVQHDPPSKERRISAEAFSVSKSKTQ